MVAPEHTGHVIRQIDGHATTVHGLLGVADILIVAANAMRQCGPSALPSTTQRLGETLSDAARTLRDMQASVGRMLDQQPVTAAAVEVERHGGEIVRHDGGRAVVVADGILSVLDDDGEVLAAYAPRAWYAVTRVERADKEQGS